MDRRTARTFPAPSLGQLSWFAALWAFGYGAYRLYYAAGGTIGMFGTPLSLEQWRLINAFAGFLLVGVALLTLAVREAWSGRSGALLLALAWIILVACVSHAFIGIAQRLLSLQGALTIPYPFWQAIDRRQADLQALLFNEPWFLIQGLAWAALAWVGRLSGSPYSRLWIGSAIVGIVAATTAGLLTAAGVIRRVIVG
jgi:hypothetical protein